MNVAMKKAPGMTPRGQCEATLGRGAGGNIQTSPDQTSKRPAPQTNRRRPYSIDYTMTMARAAARLELPTGARLLLAMIAQHVGEDGTGFPSHRELADLTGLSERAVRKYAKALADAGLLEIEERWRDNGSQSSNLYRLKLPADARQPFGEAAGETQEPKPAATIPPGEPAPLTAAEEAELSVLRSRKHARLRAEVHGQFGDAEPLPDDLTPPQDERLAYLHARHRAWQDEQHRRAVELTKATELRREEQRAAAWEADKVAFPTTDGEPFYLSGRALLAWIHAGEFRDFYPEPCLRRLAEKMAERPDMRRRHADTMGYLLNLVRREGRFKAKPKDTPPEADNGHELDRIF